MSNEHFSHEARPAPKKARGEKKEIVGVIPSNFIIGLLLLQARKENPGHNFLKHKIPDTIPPIKKPIFFTDEILGEIFNTTANDETKRWVKKHYQPLLQEGITKLKSFSTNQGNGIWCLSLGQIPSIRNPYHPIGFRKEFPTNPSRTSVSITAKSPPPHTCKNTFRGYIRKLFTEELVRVFNTLPENTEKGKENNPPQAPEESQASAIILRELAEIEERRKRSKDIFEDLSPLTSCSFFSPKRPRTGDKSENSFDDLDDLVPLPPDAENCYMNPAPK